MRSWINLLESIVETYDEDMLHDLPEDERWLRKYLYQGLDRWPNQRIIDSLLSKKSNSQPLPIFRGMNFRSEGEMSSFVDNFNGTWKQTSGISSWSPDYETALEFSYVRKTYYPDEETFRQERIANETGERMRGVGGVLLKMVAPPQSVIEFDGGYESEVLLTPGVYPCEMEIIKPYREQIKSGFDINSYILSLGKDGRTTDSIEHYIRKNHVDDLSKEALAHLFKLDGGDQLSQTAFEITGMAPWSDSQYSEELRFFYRHETLEKAAEGFYGPTGTKLAEVAAKKIFKDFENLEKKYPDAKLYMHPLASVIRLSGMHDRMRPIIQRRFAIPYQNINQKYIGPMKDNIDWPEGGLVTIKNHLKELFEQYSLLKF